MTTSNHVIKRIFLYSVFIFFTQQCSYSHTGEGPKKVMKEVTKVGLLEIIDMMAKAEPYISVTVQVYMMLDEIRVHNFPDEEEEEQAISLAKQYALLVTENGLEECIMKNRDTSERAGSGLPSACEEIAGALKAFGGKENVARMTTNYNKYRK